MHLRSLYSAAAALTASAFIACANDSAEPDQEIRTVVFDAALEQSPDRVFDVDLDDDGVVYVFDQRERPHDLDRFVVWLPSAEAAVPLATVTDELGLPTDAPQFVLRSEPDEDVEFRSCTWICGSHETVPGEDCIPDPDGMCHVCLPWCPIVL